MDVGAAVVVVATVAGIGVAVVAAVLALQHFGHK